MYFCKALHEIWDFKPIHCLKSEYSIVLLTLLRRGPWWLSWLRVRFLILTQDLILMLRAESAQDSRESLSLSLSSLSLSSAHALSLSL